MSKKLTKKQAKELVKNTIWFRANSAINDEIYRDNMDPEFEALITEIAGPIYDRIYKAMGMENITHDHTVGDLAVEIFEDMEF